MIKKIKTGYETTGSNRTPKETKRRATIVAEQWDKMVKAQKQKAKTCKFGRIEKTNRGFEFIDFEDYYGKPCRLQQSSMALTKIPGTGAVWLGVNVERSDSMHLTQKQVRTLISHLNAWLETGSFRQKG
jgi:hypothetical protein